MAGMNRLRFILLQVVRITVLHTKATSAMLVWRQVHTQRRGFTLLELLVSVAIISILLGLLLSTLHGSRNRASDVVCISNLKQIYQALHMYEQDQGYLPGRNMPGVGSIRYLTRDYYGDARIFICPSQRALRMSAHPRWGAPAFTANYMDAGLGGYQLGEFESGFAIVFDGTNVFDSNPHWGGQNNLFGDGHAKWMPAKKCDVDARNYLEMKNEGTLDRYHLTFPDYYYKCGHEQRN